MYKFDNNAYLEQDVFYILEFEFGYFLKHFYLVVLLGIL